jgi:formylglycine-generating enzyme required for sulfatase activity
MKFCFRSLTDLNSKIMKRICTFLIAMVAAAGASANNIQISNITVAQPNITFTISWDNSWNTMSNINPLYPNNWDGAWVFIKYQNNIDNLWKHATVSSTTGDHTITGGILQVDPVTDGMGVFLRRTVAGNGTVTANVTLKMNSLTGTGNFNFKVFGTEVVYVPQAAYQLGDGNTTGFFTPTDVNAAKQASGFAAGTLYSGSPAIPAAFPTGYNAFYMMKYEITNEQWADFLNTLTYDQQVIRTDIVPNSAVNSKAYVNNVNTMADEIIKMQASGLNNTIPATYGCDLDNDNVYNEANDGQNIAISIISKADLYAFLDWSGLRPFTEMEYEKACRGNQPRVLSEYAWGSTDMAVRTRGNMTTPGLPTEGWTGIVQNGQVIAGGGPNGALGPVRVGQFGTTSTGRASAGAGFYGNMDLTGNVWELCVMADATGNAFTGTHGNGGLTTLGEADAATWPGGAAAGGTTSKGGSWYETSNYNLFTMVSYRQGVIAPGRTLNLGGRGARTAP